MDLMELLTTLNDVFNVILESTDVQEIKEIAEALGNRDLDESDAGGLWDLSNELFKNDYEKQEIAYNLMYFVNELVK